MNHLVNHIAECCKRLDIRHEQTFHRIGTGNFGRSDKDIINRWATWYLARAWHSKLGQYSLQEITDGSQMKGHCTVSDGVSKFAYAGVMVGRMDEAVKLLRTEGHKIVLPGEHP